MILLEKRTVVTSDYSHWIASIFWAVCLLLPSHHIVVRSDNAYDWEPSVSLYGDLDEPRKLGFCIDIKGFGSGINCDSLQAHSCKKAGADTQFEYHSATKALRAVNFDSNCDVTSSANDRACVVVSGDLVDGASLGLTQCDDSSEKQTFEAKQSKSGYVLLAGGAPTGLCLAVSDTTRSAGSYVARNLFIADCFSTDATLLIWTVSPTPPLPPTGPCIDSNSECCKNDRVFRYQNKKKKKCKWIGAKTDRRMKFCKKNAVEIACPMSCGLCCADDESYSFKAQNGKNRNCAYIAKKSSRIEKYCAVGSIKSNCPKTCDYCLDSS